MIGVLITERGWDTSLCCSNHSPPCPTGAGETFR